MMASQIGSRVLLHPIVLFQIIESFERRSLDSPRVIGALLGNNDKAGRIEVINCYCVLHKEHEDKVEAELTYASEMFDLCLRVYPQETIVGWYTTGIDITVHSSLIHDYYMRECTDPIHLTVDTQLTGGHFGVSAFVSVQLGVPGGTMGSMFTPIPVEFIQKTAELTSFKFLYKSALQPNVKIKQKTEFEQILETTIDLEEQLNQVLKYVNDVLARKRRPDNVVGRELYDLIHSVPFLKPEQFKHTFNENVRDMLMLITLSSLIKVQLQIGEKLACM